eukprot:53960_1
MSSQILPETSNQIVSHIDVLNNGWKIGTSAMVFDENINYQCEVVGFNKYPSTYNTADSDWVIAGKLKTTHTRVIHTEKYEVDLEFIIYQNIHSKKSKLIGKKSITNIPNSTNDVNERFNRDHSSFDLSRIFNPHQSVNQLTHHTKIRIEGFIKSLHQFIIKHNNKTQILSQSSKTKCDDEIYWLFMSLVHEKTDETKLNQIHQLIENIGNEIHNSNVNINNINNINNISSVTDNTNNNGSTNINNTNNNGSTNINNTNNNGSTNIN